MLTRLSPSPLSSFIHHTVTHLWLGSGFELLELLSCCFDGRRCSEQLRLCDHCWILGIHPLWTWGRQAHPYSWIRFEFANRILLMLHKAVFWPNMLHAVIQRKQVHRDHTQESVPCIFTSHAQLTTNHHSLRWRQSNGT